MVHRAGGPARRRRPNLLTREPGFRCKPSRGEPRDDIPPVSVTISQTAKSLTIVEHVRNDLPNAGVFVFLADATTQPPNVFGSFPLNSKGSALFEVHQTTTIPTGVNSGDSIVLALPTGDTTPPVILMASDPANCGV